MEVLIEFLNVFNNKPWWARRDLVVVWWKFNEVILNTFVEVQQENQEDHKNLELLVDFENALFEKAS